MKKVISNRWFAAPPPGYCRPGIHMRYAFEEVHTTAHNDIGIYPILRTLKTGSLELYVKQVSNIQFWQRTNGVTVFPSEDLVRMCLRTDSMSGVLGSDIKASFPTVLFALPESCAYKVDSHRSIGHLLVTLHDSETKLKAVIDKEPIELAMPPGARHLLITAFWNEVYVNNFSIPLRNEPIKDSLDQVRAHFIADERRIAAMSQEQVTREQEETTSISEWACAMSLNFFLLMQSYPQFVTRMSEKHERSHVYVKKPKPLTFSLSRVRSLLPKAVVDGEAVEEEHRGGSHNSPNAHWRRGHWRRQPHSTFWFTKSLEQGAAPKEIDLADGRKAHMVWIEPVFVGIKEARISKESSHA